MIIWTVFTGILLEKTIWWIYIGFRCMWIYTMIFFNFWKITSLSWVYCSTWCNIAFLICIPNFYNLKNIYIYLRDGKKFTLKNKQKNISPRRTTIALHAILEFMIWSGFELMYIFFWIVNRKLYWIKVHHVHDGEQIVLETITNKSKRRNKVLSLSMLAWPVCNYFRLILTHILWLNPLLCISIK